MRGATIMGEKSFTSGKILAVPGLELGEATLAEDALEASPQAIWDWFADELRTWRTQRDDDRDAEKLVQLDLRLLHSRLRRSRSGYAVALDVARLPRAMCPKDWLWQPLYESREIRAGLVTVYADQPMPLHDHPDADCLMLVVYGRARLGQYRVLGEADEAGRVELKCVADRHVDSGNVLLARHEVGNVVGVASAAPQTVVLTIVTPPYAEAARAWYSPLEAPGGRDTTLKAERMGGAAQVLPLHGGNPAP